MTDLTEEASRDARRAGRPRRRLLRRVLIGTTVLAMVVVGVLWSERPDLTIPPEGCTIATDAGSDTLDLSQTANASTIAAVAISRGLPERAVAVALATAMQESKLRDLPGGDLDSVGLFQQRPSQGWGTAEQLDDPVFATNKFLDALVRVPGYARMPLADAAQAVQKSGYPDAYAQHETDATMLATALTGQAPAALNCVVDGSPAAGSPGSAVTDLVRREFGRTVTTTQADPAPKDPRPVLALRPQASASVDTGADGLQQSGWAVAQWAVAQAHTLGIGQVAYAGRIWRVDRPLDGWKAQAQGTPSDRVLVTLGTPPKH